MQEYTLVLLKSHFRTKYHLVYYTYQIWALPPSTAIVQTRGIQV